MQKPKCRLCGEPHWSTEPCAAQGKIVVATKKLAGPEEVCPTCGHPVKKYPSNAARQRAYRARKTTS